MYAIAVSHPIGHRRFATRADAVAICVAWGFGPWRVHLNLRKEPTGVGHVPTP